VIGAHASAHAALPIEGRFGGLLKNRSRFSNSGEEVIDRPQRDPVRARAKPPRSHYVG
jgi:hypothetical protein